MKKHGETLVPRKQDLNNALIALGHKTHKDKRTKSIIKNEQYKKQKEWLEDKDYE